MTCTSKSYHCDFFTRLNRRIGQSGNAQVNWVITVKSPGDAPSPANTFNVTSGQVDMPDGVEMVMLPIMVSYKAAVKTVLRGHFLTIVLPINLQGNWFIETFTPSDKETFSWILTDFEQPKYMYIFVSQKT